MKHLVLFLLFCFNLCHSEGFYSETLIKIPHGYTKISNLRIGDQVICRDAAKNGVESIISSIVTKSIDRYVCIHIAEESICVACDQQLYDEKTDSWIAAVTLQNGDILAGHAITVELINDSIDVYLLTVEQHHNFFASSFDVCAHNFVPVIVVGISVLFGGGLEIAGVTLGVAGLGGYLGYQWHKKNKQKHDIVIQSQFYGGGMVPEDPEEEKKRKRDEAREEHRPLTNKEAQEIAKEFGHRQVKDHPCGNTRNKPVFFNGKNYISPDADGHNGGLWKIFDRRGNILYSMSRRFEEVVKFYTK